MGNLIYQENFVKTVSKEEVSFIIKEIRMAHPTSSGWVMGEPDIKPNFGDRKVTISIPLAKYEKDINVEYQEDFVKSNVLKEDVNYILNEVSKSHPVEYGWSIGKPLILPDKDGKVTIIIPLAKQKIEYRSSSR